MVENFIKREEYNKGQARVHEKVDKAIQASISIEAASKNIETMVNRMHEAMFGNGRPGIIAKVYTLMSKTSTNFKLIMVCLTGILGVALYVVRQMLIK